MRLFLTEKTLRRILVADAMVCLSSGGILLLGLAFWAELTGLPSLDLTMSALVLFPVGALMLWTGTRPSVPVLGVTVILAGNVIWIASSLWILLGDAYSLTALGSVFVLMQAVIALGFTELEFLGLRGLKRKDLAAV